YQGEIEQGGGRSGRMAIRIFAAAVDIAFAPGSVGALKAQCPVSHFGFVNQSAQERGESNGHQQPANQDIQEHCVSSRSNRFDECRGRPASS
ncbi:hypothetical protein, partial [Pseudomonas sp. KK4]|uniref:hypothetical protein n=1 Tax=Pseudomonas sp. KK4 TaxID=1855729 RepID=UPI00158DE068